ncbi:PT domain-containing protein [Rothia sp. BD8]|uniref:PT domain-containing protein n=1 Tax=Rothia sp. BD8 TaxID=2953894 RepID=UPI0038411014
MPVQQDSILPGQDADAPVGHIARIDLANPQTQQRHQVTQPRPSDVVSSADGSRLYVLNASDGSITVLDARSGAVEREIEGVVTSSNGIVLDSDSGDLYVFDNFGLQRVIPGTGEVMERTEVSRHERPFVRDAVYDAQHRLVWLANANEGVVTAYSTVTHQWVRTVRVPVAEYRFEDTVLGANPRSLAIDPQLGNLYIGTSGSKVAVVQTSTGKHLGAPISVVGESTSLTVNPRTHEVVAGHGRANTVSVISPQTWTVASSLDLHAAGITGPAGFFTSDVTDVETGADGTEVYVSHERTGRVSILDRSGDIPEVTPLSVAPGQDEAPDPQEPGPGGEPWDGPATADPLQRPADAVEVSHPSLSWAVNDYMRSWTPEPLGPVTREGQQYVFGEGRGWYDGRSGRASVAWDGGVRIRHYAIMAPGVITSFGNPRLDVEADGSARLSVELSWMLNDENSGGYHRVTMATFDHVELSREGQRVTVTGTPDFAGREYREGDRVFSGSFPGEFIDALHPDMRPRWYASGSGGDAKKTPLPLSVSFDAEQKAAEPTPEPTSEPTAEPTADPTAEPTAEPTSEPTVEPTAEPMAEPTSEPTVEPTAEPMAEPTAEPTSDPADPTVPAPGGDEDADAEDPEGAQEVGGAGTGQPGPDDSADRSDRAGAVGTGGGNSPENGGTGGPSDAGSGNDGSGGGLAATGARTGGYLAVGALLLALGAGALTLRHRRRA